MASGKHRQYRRWSRRDEEFLAKNYEFALAEGVGSEARATMCRVLGRDWDAIRVRHSLMAREGRIGPAWTNEERALLLGQLAAASRDTGKTADECLAELLRLRRRAHTDARNRKGDGHDGE